MAINNVNRPQQWPRRGWDTSEIIPFALLWLFCPPAFLLWNYKVKIVRPWLGWLFAVISPLGMLGVYFLFRTYLEGIGMASEAGMKHIIVPATDNPALENLVHALNLVCIPIYMVCVVVLGVTMAIFGWNYQEASVYVCEYFEPWACVGVAVFAILMMLWKWRWLRKKARPWMALLMAAEAGLAVWNVQVYRERVAEYAGMDINGIFNHVVDKLMATGAESGTNYVMANMYVYIVPMLVILILGYIGRSIYRSNKRSQLGQVYDLAEPGLTPEE